VLVEGVVFITHGGSMALNFRSKRSEGRVNAALELTVQVRAILDVDDDTVVSISEHDCGEPGCSGTRTVVLLLRPGQPTEAIKIEKPIESVSHADLTAALVPQSCTRTQDSVSNDTSTSNSIPAEPVPNFNEGHAHDRHSSPDACHTAHRLSRLR
jgi:hypothetical protein